MRQLDYQRKTYISQGERALLLISHSEVSMHMGIAGKLLEVEITAGPYPMAQVYVNGRQFSAPITTGEAGFYQDSEGYYYYPPLVK